ncbi:hypothetical protein BGX33_000195 [Mortierella sp. NVP41]|nr:hypothetical protein BGX33_000195 [Mortierella sp. NVP41]
MSGKISDTYNKAVGGTKEKIGHATHNERMAGQGAAQKAEAQIHQQNQQAGTHAHGIGHNVEGGVQPTVGSATNVQPTVGSATTDPSMQARGQANEALGGTQRNY